MPQIEVTFDIDANGIVNVSAKDKGTNKATNIVIKSDGGLSEADIARMVKEAEDNAAADQAKKAAVDARNTAEALVHSTEKALKDYGDKVDGGTKDKIAADLKALQDVLADASADVDSIKAAADTLSESSMELGKAMYEAQMKEAQGAAPEGMPNPDGSMDAEFKDVGAGKAS